MTDPRSTRITWPTRALVDELSRAMLHRGTAGGQMRLHAGTQVSRIFRRVLVVLALIGAVCTVSGVSPPPANAASAGLVQSRDAQVTSGTKASLAFSKANAAGNLIVVYVVWDNPGP